MRVRHAAVIALFVPTWAWASFLTGNELKDLCDGGNEYWCMAYIVGVADASGSLASWGISTRYVCVPNNASSKQLKSIVEKYINEHPEKLHQSASSQVLNALSEAFPCSQ